MRFQMRIRSLGIPAWAGAFAVLVLALRVPAGDDPPVDETPDPNRKIQALMEASVEWHELLPNAHARTPLTPQVALRWINPSRGRHAQDILVLWVHDGRPIATASVFPRDGYLCHELGSLSRGAELVARDGDIVVWAPDSAGVEFNDFPDSPPPAESPIVRLRQMKSLGERLTATLTGWNEDDSAREVLRLLPRPLYRYDMNAAKQTHADLRDGALFAFVQGTDPEALLLLEAVVVDDQPRWQYAFSRATSGGLEARLGDELVWKAERFADSQSRTKPHITLKRVIDN